MGRRTLPFLILGAFAATPVNATTSRPDQPRAAAAEDPVARINAEMQRYGQWLARVSEAERRVQQQLMGLQAAWQQALSRPRPEGLSAMRDYIRNALAEIDAADAAVAALEVPRLDSLELPEDVRPAAVRAQVGRLNRDIRAVMADFLPVLDALGSNPAAAGPAALRLLGNMRLVFASQLVMLRAQQAATPREDPEWELTGFEVSFLRAAQRIFQAFNPMHPELDGTLPADLIAIADELDGNIRSAERKVMADIAQFDADLAAAERAGDANQIVVLRRARAVLAINRDYLPLARQLSVRLRQDADLLRGQILTPELLERSFEPLREIRNGLDEVALRQVRAMADTP